MPGKTLSVVIILYSNVFPAVGRGINDRDLNRRSLESGSLRPVERAPDEDDGILQRSPGEDWEDGGIMKRSSQYDVVVVV